jgi:hypothetical protein
MNRFFTIMLLGGAIASTAICDTGDFQWQGQLTPGQLLEIRGVIGSITAVGTSGSQARVSVHKSGTNNDPAEVNIQVVPYDGGVVICAMYPDTGQRPPNQCNPPGMDVYVSNNNSDVRVDFTVAVPQNVKLGAYTVNGGIDAEMLTGDVTAATINGDITVTTTGTVQATTLKGTIHSAMGAAAWTGVRMLDTGEGDIVLQMPADSQVEVRASAFQGAITSDFPLAITSSRFGNSTIASSAPDGNSGSLRLSTFNGNITIRQGPASAR